VISNRMEATGDRIVTPDISEPRYRILAVLPHGWSTLLIEDDRGRTFTVDSTTRCLTPIDSDDARQLIDERAFRTWQGDRDWSSLDRLLLLSSSAGRAYTLAAVDQASAAT
jgi:hypothetical protein